MYSERAFYGLIEEKPENKLCLCKKDVMSVAQSQLVIYDKLHILKKSILTAVSYSVFIQLSLARSNKKALLFVMITCLAYGKLKLEELAKNSREDYEYHV